VAFLAIAIFAMPLPAHARVHVSVGIGLPFPVVVAPALVLVAGPPVVVGAITDIRDTIATTIGGISGNIGPGDTTTIAAGTAGKDEEQYSAHGG
jgi:hypothetical protein